MKLTQEQKLELKDRQDFDRDPLARLNKAQTKRLEEAYFAQLEQEREEYEEKYYNLN